MKSLGNKLYTNGNGYYGRIKLPTGKWTYRAVRNRDGSEIPAESEARDRLIIIQAEINTGEEPIRRAAGPQDGDGHRVDALISRYAAEGYPDTEQNPRKDNPDTLRAFGHLQSFFGQKSVEDLCLGDCHAYHTYRTSVAKRGTGKRSADLDLTQLSIMLDWAREYQIIRVNPITKRRRYQKRKLVKNCTQFMPMSDEELHDLIADIMENTRFNAMLGHQGMLEATTGGRTSEILQLLANAEFGQPGYWNDEYLYINRIKDGIYPYVVMHEPLRQILVAAKEFKDKHHPHSKYLLVGKDGITPPFHDSLTHALQASAKRLGLGPKTSHGLRAYYVRVCRSQGIPDQEIGMRLGHRSGVSLIKDTYGLNEPGLFGQKKLDFMPENELPAWERKQ